MKDVLCIILGGGRGTRLYPLTKYRAKPAVPIAGKYRLIDIPISNCLNSGLHKIFILTQFNSESLNKHIFRAYKFDFFSQGFVEILAAEQSLEHADWFQGSADAVRKCLKHITDPRIRYILVLSGDQLYKMNFAEMVNFHIEKKSEITIACNPVTKEETPDLGIMALDSNLGIRKFIEKPKKDISDFAIDIDGETKFLASMGIYVFNREVLSELLTANNKMDFGREIIPEALVHKKTFSFIHKGYWKDIGSIKSFYEENLAFNNPTPPLDLFDENWQFFTRPRYLPLSRILNSHIENSSISEGAIIEKARIVRSIIGLRSRIAADSLLEDSIIMGSDFYDNQHHRPKGDGVSEVPSLGVGSNCVIKKAIVDKNVRIGNNVKLTNEKNLLEFENKYCVIRSGIIIIPKNTIIPSNSII